MTSDGPRPRPPQSVEGGVRSPSTITLLDMEPDLDRLLTPEQRAAAEHFALPLETVEKNEDLPALTEESDAFGAIVLDGLLLETVEIDGREAMSLIGPGALVPVKPSADWLARAQVRATEQTRLVMLGKPFLIAAQRWPSVVVCLHERMLEQSVRLTKQLAISQLPRVEDRVVGILKLLAETWGVVTPAGINLQLSLTHETLGRLIGARRPSVSLALKALTDRNVIIRRGNGWLITGD